MNNKNKYAAFLGILIILDIGFYAVIHLTYFVGSDCYLLTKGIVFINGIYLLEKLGKVLFLEKDNKENNNVDEIISEKKKVHKFFEIHE